MVVISFVADQYFFRVEGKSIEISPLVQFRIFELRSMKSFIWVLQFIGKKTKSHAVFKTDRVIFSAYREIPGSSVFLCQCFEVVGRALVGVVISSGFHSFELGNQFSKVGH